MHCGLLDQAGMRGQMLCGQWKGVGGGPLAQELGEPCVANPSLSPGLSFLTFMAVIPPTLSPLREEEEGERTCRGKQELPDL